MFIGNGPLSDQAFVTARVGDFARALENARNGITPSIATQQPVNTQQQQAIATTPSAPNPDPENKDPAYMLLNRGGSLKLDQEQKAIADLQARDPYGYNNLHKNQFQQAATSPVVLLSDFRNGLSPIGSVENVPFVKTAVSPLNNAQGAINSLANPQADPALQILRIGNDLSATGAADNGIGFAYPGFGQLDLNGGYNYPGFGSGWGANGPSLINGLRLG